MSRQRLRLWYANRTPWQEATREVTYLLRRILRWCHGKAPRGGVPSHVMLKLLRRRLRERYPS